MTAPLLSDTTLAQMRAIQEANMPSVCELLTFANTREPGGITVRAAAIKATVPCRLSLLASSLPLVADQFTPAGQYTLTLPAGTDTADVERAIVGGVTAGVTWEVELVITGTDEPRTYSASRRLRAQVATDPVGHPAAVPFPYIGHYPSLTIYPQAA